MLVKCSLSQTVRHTHTHTGPLTRYRQLARQSRLASWEGNWHSSWAGSASPTPRAHPGRQHSELGREGDKAGEGESAYGSCLQKRPSGDVQRGTLPSPPSNPPLSTVKCFPDTLSCWHFSSGGGSTVSMVLTINQGQRWRHQLRTAAVGTRKAARRSGSPCALKAPCSSRKIWEGARSCRMLR